MKIYEDLINLMEEFINELDYQTVQQAIKKRRADALKAEGKKRSRVNQPPCTPSNKINEASSYLMGILSLIEEFINELDDETVQAAYNKRRQNTIDADNELARALRDSDKSEEELDVLRKKASEADKKFGKNLKLVGARDKRLEKKLAAFKKMLLSKRPQKASETQKAGSDHDNAMINQHFRDRLEKSLAVSNECFEEIMAMIEGFING